MTQLRSAGRRSVLIAALAVVALLAACAQSDAGGSAGGRSGAATPATSAPPATSVAPATTPAPAASPTGAEESADAGGRSGTSGDCAAYRDSGGWCENGIGDYDCEGGTGNGPNYAPRGIDVVEPGEDPFGLDRDGDGDACEGEAAAPDREPDPAPGADTDPRFGTCGEAIDSGYGPYYQGQDPEYDWYRDADSDGVVCE